MNIALIGYGAMGQALHALAEKKGHSVVAIIDPHAVEATDTALEEKTLRLADVAIDFSIPDQALQNIEIMMNTSTPLVMGTTGWYDALPQVQQLVESSGNGLLWSSNFSIGVNYYFKILETASKIFNQSDIYDIWANELHHTNKVDSPSGTAKTIGEILLKHIDRKSLIQEEKVDRALDPQEIHFSSTRGGTVNFEHTVGFDSAEDTITIRHSARNRNGYVQGALLSAEWMRGKRGLYTFEDIIF